MKKLYLLKSIEMLNNFHVNLSKIHYNFLKVKVSVLWHFGKFRGLLRASNYSYRDHGDHGNHPLCSSYIGVSSRKLLP